MIRLSHTKTTSCELQCSGCGSTLHRFSSVFNLEQSSIGAESLMQCPLPLGCMVLPQFLARLTLYEDAGRMVWVTTDSARRQPTRKNLRGEHPHQGNEIA